MNTDQDLFSKVISAHQKAEDFRKDHTTNRYPVEFKDLVRSAMDAGLTAHKIHQATGINLNTLCSWRKPLNNIKDIVCFEPVKLPRSDTEQEKGRIILPSGVEILVPLPLIEEQLVTCLRQEAA